MILNADHISVTIGGKRIVNDVSFTLEAGEKMMIVGPNGAGKTTLIRAVMQTAVHEGTATLNGRDLSTLHPAELARQVGVLTQTHYPQFDYTVHDVVAMGRYAHRSGLFEGFTGRDAQITAHALELTGLTALAEASIRRLSGGELQRVFLAQLFAQDPSVLVLDEPTNNLDLAYQIALFDLIDGWLKTGGKAVISVIHDLNMVYKYATKALLMKDGAVRAIGTPENVLSPENLQDVYAIDVAGWMRGLLRHWERGPC